ncbi:MAG: hypothetical protein IKD07_05365, partial [Clostridia bacterium]|nr:hypothetical protein [Clostridia bacterium]
SGCFAKKTVPIEYTAQILVDRERPDEAFVWAGKFETPSKGGGGLPLFYSDSEFFGVVSGQKIETVKMNEQDRYIKPFASTELHELLGMKKDDLEKKFRLAIYPEKYSVWEDATLIHFLVPEDNVYEGEPTEYAGKYVFIEYREKEKQSYILAFTPEEYGATAEGQIKSAYTGRIGDICYFVSGYYDLSSHSYQRYETEDSLPCYPIESRENDAELLNVLKQDAVLSAHLQGKDLFAADRCYLLNDRIYAAFVSGVNEEEGYEGSELLLVMLDADTYEVLYAEKYSSSNYYMGARSAVIGMYRKGTDGYLYDPYVID